MKQLDERNKNPGKPPFDPYLAIEVLRAVIKHLEHSAAEIQHCLNKAGVKIKMKQTEGIFSFYDLGKKTLNRHFGSHAGKRQMFRKLDRTKQKA